ncbi:hypothetical protein L6452_22853 [Arctium lappa]|uniref:Uncharacterized protein n=1 Tax=Arctium lappa TaxID=4217 RepID=A0ACB9B121_ARCLA|nr:hypothetical protein L6452_22853 [Arctium lappa]
MVPATGGVKILVYGGVEGVVIGKGKLGSVGRPGISGGHGGNEGIPVDGISGGHGGNEGIPVDGISGGNGGNEKVAGKPETVKRRRAVVAWRLPEKMRAARRERMTMVEAIWGVVLVWSWNHKL